MHTSLNSKVLKNVFGGGNGNGTEPRNPRIQEHKHSTPSRDSH